MMQPNQNILQYIPQRPPFVMVDELLDYNENTSSTRFLVAPDNIFVFEGFLQEPGLLENIAQTAAAHAGAMALISQEPVKVGYIGTVKNFSVNELPPVNAKIETTVTVHQKVFDVSLVTGAVFFENREIASCEMKIFIIK